jgi:hypothetical protein
MNDPLEVFKQEKKQSILRDISIETILRDSLTRDIEAITTQMGIELSAVNLRRLKTHREEVEKERLEVEQKIEALYQKLNEANESLNLLRQEEDISLLDKVDNERYVIILSGTIDAVNRNSSEAIVAHLRKLVKDASLTLHRIESGSIKLFLEGSSEGFNILRNLWESGELTEILGLPIEKIELAHRNQSPSQTQVQPTISNTMKQQREQVFISYSHKDKEWLEKLTTMLKPLVRNQTINVWDDTKIKAGSQWKDEINEALAAAKIAVLIVSPNFLASDFIAEHELPPLLQVAKQEGLTIIWVCISSCLYQETEIGNYQAAHDISRPLKKLSEAELDDVLVDICQKIKALSSKNP